MVLQEPTLSGSVILSGPLEIYGGISASYFEGDGAGLTGLTATISGSIAFENLTNKPTFITSSAQVDFLSLSNLPATVLSSSAQVDLNLASGTAPSASYALTASYVGSAVTSSNSDLATEVHNQYLQSGSIKFWSGPKIAYDSISGSADPNTIYYIVS